MRQKDLHRDTKDGFAEHNKVEPLPVGWAIVSHPRPSAASYKGKGVFGGNRLDDGLRSNQLWLKRAEI